MEMKPLHQWFLKNQRDFFWRRHPSPYIVWISEVMLQQTRASVVEPYLKKWLALFPDVHSLACAPIERVLKAWEGLGYYSRARNLHLAAKQIVETHQGQIPSDPSRLSKIQGIGPYTQGAILSFAFHQKAPAVDGNVVRVISRLFAIEDFVEKASVKKEIFQKVEGLLDSQKPWVTMEALIELGSTVCQPTPRCEDCPLQMNCKARKENLTQTLPLKKEKEPTIFLYRAVAVILSQDKVLLVKGEKKKVMADLYQFPYFEMEKWTHGRKKAEEGARFLLEQNVRWLEFLGQKSHTFTKYKAHLEAHLFEAKECKSVEQASWVPLSEMSHIPFSSGHRFFANLLSNQRKL